MRRAVLGLALALLALGCDESDQNSFVVKVTEINNGVPLLSDVAEVSGGITIIPTDVVPVELTNLPYSPGIVDPNSFALDFQLTRYTVAWRATAGTPAGLNLPQWNHTEAAALIVPLNDTATLGALITTTVMKSAAPFQALATSGGTIPAIADIDFVGHSAVNPATLIHVRVSLSVVFADFENLP